jgi:hypothetical protein
MKLFFSATTFCIVSVTLVQAAPIPMTELLQSGVRAINKGFDSMLDSVCTSCILKSDIEEISHPPLTKKQRLETTGMEIKTSRTTETTVPPNEPLKITRKSTPFELVAMDFDEIPDRQLDSYQKDLAAAALLSLKNGDITEGSLPTSDLELQLTLASVNTAASVSKGQTTIDEKWVKELNPKETKMKKINDIDAPIETKSVSFSPGVTTFDSKTLQQLEQDLLLAQNIARESEFESTTALANIGQVNEIWNEQIGREANPLKTQTVKFNFANQ